MKQIILIPSIVLLCASVLLAQGKPENKPAKCTLGLDRVPELRGLRLGMPQSSVLARFPGTSVAKPDKFGVAQLRLSVIDSGSLKGLPARDKGVQMDISSDPDSERAFVVDSAKFPALNGVRRIQMRFLDGRLTNIQIAYDDSITWNNVDEFVETVAQILNLPKQWDLPLESDGASQLRELRCEGFVITGDTGADASDTRIAAQLSVDDLAATQTIEKRQNAVKEKAQREEDGKKKTFKP